MQATVKLNSGHLIPVLGLGVYQARPGAPTYEGVLSALKLGYRHVDTAQCYGNEADVGKAILGCGIPRDNVFVTSKVWLTEWGHDRTLESIKQSLKRMGLSYVDLMLLHAPGEPSLRNETWAAMEDAHAAGLCRSIGVSNFGIPHLEKLLRSCRVPPAVNQIEVTPFLQRRELVDYCQQKGIVVEAYSPLAKAQKLKDKNLLSVAGRTGLTVAQVLICWGLQKGLVSLPKSVNPERQAENLSCLTLTLPHEEMAFLDTLEEGLVTGWDPVSSAPV